MSYHHISEIGLYPSKRYAYDGNNNLIYQGLAAAASAEEDEKWAIIKMEYDGVGNLISEKFPEGSPEYKFVWANRESYTYN